MRISPSVSLRSPAAVLWSEPSLLTCELAILVCAFLTLKDALKHRGRALTLWLGALTYGFCVEFVTPMNPSYEVQWHAQSSIMLNSSRVPLYIALKYPFMVYVAYMTVTRLKLRAQSEPWLMALGVLSLSMPFEMLGSKFLWWTYHDTDPNLAQRFYGVPWYHMMSLLYSTTCFLYGLHYLRRLLTCRKRRHHASDHKAREVAAAVVAGFTAVPGGALMSIPLFHLCHYRWAISQETCFFYTLCVYLVAIWLGERSRFTLKSRFTRTPDSPFSPSPAGSPMASPMVPISPLELAHATPGSHRGANRGPPSPRRLHRRATSMGDISLNQGRASTNGSLSTHRSASPALSTHSQGTLGLSTASPDRSESGAFLPINPISAGFATPKERSPIMPHRKCRAVASPPAYNLDTEESSSVVSAATALARADDEQVASELSSEDVVTPLKLKRRPSVTVSRMDVPRSPSPEPSFNFDKLGPPELVQRGNRSASQTNTGVASPTLDGDLAVQISAYPSNKIKWKEGPLDWRKDLVYVVVVVHFIAMLTIALYASPESTQAMGYHQEIGSCATLNSVQTPFGVKYRHKYLCITDYRKDFDFRCLRTQPYAGQRWYAVCGTPYKNAVEFVLAVICLCVGGLVVFSHILRTRIRLIEVGTPRVPLDTKKGK